MGSYSLRTLLFVIKIITGIHLFPVTYLFWMVAIPRPFESGQETFVTFYEYEIFIEWISIR